MNQSDIKNYWDNKFELFEEHSSGYIDPYIQKIDDKIRWGTFIREVNLNPNEKILDAGCNFGLWSIRLAKLGLEVIGIDLINEAIKKAKKKASSESLNIKFFQGRIEDINFKKNFFDKILSVTVLQHIIDDKNYFKTLKKFYSQLNEKGLLILVESASNKKIEEKLSYKRERTFYEQKKILKNAGFELVMSKGVNHLSAKWFYGIKKFKSPKFLENSMQKLFLPALCQLDLFLSRFSSLSRFAKLKLMIFKKIQNE